MVNYEEKSDSKAGTDWELPILTVLADATKLFLDKKIDQDSFQSYIAKIPLRPRRLSREKYDEIDEFISKIVEKVKALPRAMTNERLASKNSRLSNQKRGEDADLERRKIASEILNLRLTYDDAIAKAEIDFIKLIKAELQNEQGKVNSTIKEKDDEKLKGLEKEIYEKVIELKCLLDNSSIETKEHIKKQFQLYVKILAVNIETK